MTHGKHAKIRTVHTYTRKKRAHAYKVRINACNSGKLLSINQKNQISLLDDSSRPY